MRLVFPILMSLLALTALPSIAQVSVNTDNSAPHPSAMMDVKSSDKGMLIPRMTSAQRNLISAPAIGLLVFDTDTESFWFRDSGGWVELVAGGSSDSGFAYDPANKKVLPDTGLIDVVNSDFVFGSPQLDEDGNGDHNTRLFFDKSKAAFRAGRAENNQWDESEVGFSSISLGYNTIASGSYGVSLGSRTEALNVTSVALGFLSKAVGHTSFAVGSQTEAQGLFSTSMGRLTTAHDYGETVIGEYNILGTGDQSNWIPIDNLFTIGNGISPNRSNAFQVLKNANTFVGGSLTINANADSMTFPTDNGLSGQVLTTDGAGTLSWTSSAGGGLSPFEFDAVVGNGTVRSNSLLVGSDTADFVFGSPQLEYIGNYDEASRFFFDKSKAAFRAGSGYSNWNPDSIGNYSIALGNNAKAKGIGSFASGHFTFATGDYSIAMGSFSKANGYSSLAMGQYAVAEGSSSVAIGNEAQANGFRSYALGDHARANDGHGVAIGNETRANGYRSVAMGYESISTGDQSISIGFDNRAIGNNSISIGAQNRAEGSYSKTLGHYTTAHDYAEVTLGQYNIVGDGDSTSWKAADNLLTLGNGTSPSNRSNALTVLKNANTYVGGSLTINANADSLTFPTTDGTSGQVLSTNGNGQLSWTEVNGVAPFIYDSDSSIVRSDTSLYDISQTDFLFGSPEMNFDPLYQNRFFFDKSKGAFRAGGTQNNNWNQNNLGNYSAAFGLNGKASGDNSFSAGEGNTASGYAGTAFGFTTVASGNVSFSTGSATQAKGYASFSTGSSTTTQGDYSIASGNSTTAEDYAEIVGGQFNILGTGSPSSWVAGDNLFTLGNGVGTSSRSNAFQVLKNGNTLVGGSLVLNANSDSLIFPTIDGTNGQTLITNGSGQLSWGHTSSINDGDNDTRIAVDNGSDNDQISFTTKGTKYFVMEDGRLHIDNTNGSTFIGYDAGKESVSSLITGEHTFIGFLAGEKSDMSFQNVAIGSKALRLNISGNNNSAIGTHSLENNKGSHNTALGYLSLNKNTTGGDNVGIGSGAGYRNQTGSNNVLIGTDAGNGNTNHNKSNNTMVGHEAGYTSQGSNNIFLGHQAGYNESGSNKLYIENSNSASPLLYGEFNNDLVKINGSLTPDSLNVNDTYGFPTSDGSTGQILVTDGSGNLSWETNSDTIPSGGTNGQVLSTDGSGTLSWADKDEEVPSGGTNGQILSTDGSGNLSWINQTPAIPVGTIQMYIGNTAPAGWLICDGSSISDTVYPDLYTVLGGSGGTTNLPNFRGRFPLGQKYPVNPGETAYQLKGTGGEEEVTLTIAEMPSHNHNIVYREGEESGSGNDYSDLGGTGVTDTTGNKGGGQPHNNMPPYYVVNFIIKAN